jgi:hypothetical protein
MFLNENKFKKLCKDKYKGAGLTVGMTDDEVYIVSGEWWNLEVPKEFMTREILGIIVGFTGELPEKGEIYTYQEKDEAHQANLMYVNDWNLNAKYEASRDVYELTRVTYEGTSSKKRILQGKNDIAIVNEEIINLIDPDRKEKEELMENGIRKDGHILIWASSMMHFAAYYSIAINEGEQQFLESCKDIIMNW